MNAEGISRKEFFQRSLGWGLGCCGLLAGCRTPAAEAAPAAGTSAAQPDLPAELAKLQKEKDFIENWLVDLLDTMQAELDEKTVVKLIEGCGRGCFRRHSFKQDMVDEAQGSLEKLIAAYDKRFEVWQEGKDIHVRYGAVSKRCYCPVLANQPVKANALHCHCTRATHQTIFEKALGRPVTIDFVETLRRGGKTCHFVVHV